MLETVGDIWELGEGSWIGIPTNGVINKYGDLVMGAGMAKQAALRYPNLPRLLGGWVGTFGNIPFPYYTERLISIPTKDHYKNASKLSLIRGGLVVLQHLHFDRPVFLPRIGCGLGGLQWDKVRESCKNILDDRFTIVSRPNDPI